MLSTGAFDEAGREAAAAARSAWTSVYRDGGDPAPALERLGEAARAWDRWVARGLRMGDDGALGTERTLGMAGAVARGLHAGFHRAFDAAAPADRAAAADAVARAERHHLASLATMHRAARGGVPTPALSALWDGLFDMSRHPAARACALAGGLGRAGRADRALGLRASIVARRTAMLAAATVVIHRRLLDPRLRRGLAGIAARRGVLWRARPQPRLARRSPLGAAPMERIEVVGHVTATGWVDRPRIPYSFARCDGFEVRFHHRNMAAIGVAAGRHLWARGKAEADGDLPIVVGELEGPGTHAGAVWEDWLAAEARPAYDLYPRLLDMACEFPRLGDRGGSLDLIARLPEGGDDADG